MSVQEEFIKSAVRVQKFAELQQKGLDSLKQDYLKDKQIGIYNYFRQIPKQHLFTYIVIFIILSFLLNELDITFKKIMVILICALFLFYVNEMNKSVFVDEMQETKLKLNTLFPIPKFFYIDSRLIDLVYSFREYKKYNPLAFNKVIKTTDNFLKIVLDAEKDIGNIYQMIDIMKGLKQEIMNHLHSIIHNTPSDKIAKFKMDNVLDAMHYILNYHMEMMRIKSNKKFEKDGPSINNKYINRSSHPEPHDPAYDEHYDIY